jgi:hypothetical protein
MKITEDVRKFAAEQGIAEEEALKKGMEEESREFNERAASFTRRRDFRCFARDTRARKVFLKSLLTISS